MSRPVLSLCAVAFVTFFLGLGAQAITDSDEGFYAEAAREMVEGGDWLTPHFNYQDRWQKPVLYYWVAASLYTVTGPGEFSARAGAAASGLGLALVTWASARRLRSTPRASWLAGAIVATSFGCFAMARMALPDLPLAFFVTVTIWAVVSALADGLSAARPWWLLAGLAAGLGFLTKGPLAIVVPAIVVGPIAWFGRRSLRLRASDIALAAVVFVVVGIPWYVAMTATHGAPYLQSFFISDNLERFSTTKFNDTRQPLFYVPVLIGGLLPWSGFLVTLPWRKGLDTLRGVGTSLQESRILAIWIAAPFLLFSISIGKQPRYILPLLPPLAIVVARAIDEAITASSHDHGAGRRLATGLWTTVAAVVLVGALLWRATPLFVSATPVLTGACTVAVLVVALLLATVAITTRWNRLPVAMVVSSIVLLLSYQFGAIAGRRPEAVELMAARIRQEVQPGQVVGQYRAFGRNLGFYTHMAHPNYYEDRAVTDILHSPERVLVVLPLVDLERIEPQFGAPLYRLASVTLLDTAGVRLRTLLNPDPAADLQTMVLVANR